MLSIKENIKNEYIINKSKFITYLYRIDKLEDIDNYLNIIKKEYLDATHHCYAYIFEQNKKCSDDGEPNKTAGAPILHVLESNNLDHILCIVVRYFGGIKLGAGGLVHAYTKSVTECLNKTNILELKPGYLVQISFMHNNLKQIDYLLKDYDIDKNYSNNIIYEFKIRIEDYNNLINQIKQYITEVNILEEINI